MNCFYNHHILYRIRLVATNLTTWVSGKPFCVAWKTRILRHRDAIKCHLKSVENCCFFLSRDRIDILQSGMLRMSLVINMPPLCGSPFYRWCRFNRISVTAILAPHLDWDFLNFLPADEMLQLRSSQPSF